MTRLEEIENRMAEIRALLDQPDADLDALESEVAALAEERKQLIDQIEKRQRLLASVVEGDHPVLRTFPTQVKVEEPRFGVDSPEFRTAWLKKLAHNPHTGEWRLGEWTDIERRAFTYTTTNTPDAVPTGVSLGIVEQISKQYALFRDINYTTFQNVVEFTQATAIVGGKAGETTEAQANTDDLQISFNKVTMTGVEIKGSVVIGAKMRIESIDGFEQFLVNELSREMGEAINEHLFTAVDTDMLAANKLTPAGLTAADIREAFGALKGGRGSRIVYANNYTIWNLIAAVTDDMGNEKFIQSALDSDPAVQGRIYGSPVKLDDTLDDAVIYVGYPAQIKANMFQAPNVLSDIDVKTRNITYGGYALFEARLGDTRSWAKLTVGETVS